MPCLFSPVVTAGQNGEPFNEPAPVTSRAWVPYPRAMPGNLASAPEPNSMRGRREREKSVMRTDGLRIEETLNGSEFADVLSAQELGKIVGRAAVPGSLADLPDGAKTTKCFENIGNVGSCGRDLVDRSE